ncbi:hypothetical protein [Pandoraea sp. ISTKB]|uniref:hypothetical protein n=1 Tax=Pandoraea sp. ISTKB TaxID=1586708 RepID=UPI001F0A3957|nr:hypothetical protein [Pandoraea sp. ISTKB]
MEDIFAKMPFGKVALEKLAPVEQNFRLFSAGWLGDGKSREVMQISGAVFREAKSGPRKGTLCMQVPGTTRTTFVTAAEMDAVADMEGVTP